MTGRLTALEAPGAREHFEAPLRDPEAGVHMRRAAGMAQFNPVRCEAAYVHYAGGEPEG